MKRGAKLVAVEPFGYKFLAERGISVYRDLTHLPDELTFDGIVSLETIEHLRDPGGVLAGLYKRLSPGGWLLITTPNAAGLPARLMGQHWREAVKTWPYSFLYSRSAQQDPGKKWIQPSSASTLVHSISACFTVARTSSLRIAEVSYRWRFTYGCSQAADQASDG